MNFIQTLHQITLYIIKVNRYTCLSISSIILFLNNEFHIPIYAFECHSSINFIRALMDWSPLRLSSGFLYSYPAQPDKLQHSAHRLQIPILQVTTLTHKRHFIILYTGNTENYHLRCLLSISPPILCHLFFSLAIICSIQFI